MVIEPSRVKLSFLPFFLKFGTPAFFLKQRSHASRKCRKAYWGAHLEISLYQGFAGFTNATNHLCKSMAEGYLIKSFGLALLLSKIEKVKANPQFQACLAVPACFANKTRWSLFNLSSVLNPSNMSRLYNIFYLWTRKQNGLISTFPLQKWRFWMLIVSKRTATKQMY